MKQPYLKKIGMFSGFDVWIVDGEYIRTNIDEEFTNFGQHLRFKFIPKSEFWIDKEFSKGETEYFVNHMLIEWHLMHAGRSYDHAIGVADKNEITERKKSELMMKVTSESEWKHKEVPKEIYKKRIKNYEYPKIWIISGELVRDLYFIDFTEGGHHFVYDFVPFHEVWLDDDLNHDEIKFVLLHELHERYLMDVEIELNLETKARATKD